MVQSLWSDAEAGQFVDEFGPSAGEDVALRVYTSRLIGRDPNLVLHGGGNTSVKTTAKDILGTELEVLAVKGSGWDLVDIEPPGLPLVQLGALRKMMVLDGMSDEEMVNEVRRQLLDASAPNPSVEALLHAALPHKFVDHTHADAILVLTNQPDGEALVREAFGDRVAILPWIMPGFPLAKAVAAAYAENPDVEGIVLLQHGVFSFGDDAKQSYERMIDLCDIAERFADERIAGKPLMTTPCGGDEPLVPEAIWTIRGALATKDPTGRWQRLVCSARLREDLRAFSLHPECRRLVELGPLTPDHVIRTKGPYLFVTRDEALDAARLRERVAEYAARYRDYFEANKDRVTRAPTILDPHPRVVVVEGMGLLAFGANENAASIAADIATHTLRAKARAEAVGSYVELPPSQLFEMEYWSLEQAKLGKKQAPELAGQVALVTGGGGAIGRGIVEALARAGAAVVVADIDLAAANRACEDVISRVGGRAVYPVEMDVTDRNSVFRGFIEATIRFGGVDIVVPNAGVAHVKTLADMGSEDFRRVLDVNLTGTMNVLHVAANVLRDQGTGGAVVVQASKNVFAPGAAFGAYSASKAGQHQLGKVAAIEFAEFGVRVNMINADAVFGDEVKSGLWAEVGPDRMKSRGLDEAGLKEFYRERSLLGVEVTPKHVGDAVVFLASDRSAATTGTTLTVDAGVVGAFPR